MFRSQDFQPLPDVFDPPNGQLEAAVRRILDDGRPIKLQARPVRLKAALVPRRGRGRRSGDR